MPLFPDGANVYVREAESDSLIKLYEYSMPGHRSHILRKSGLLARLEVLIPEPALPIRLHECRAACGGDEARSYETNLASFPFALCGFRFDFAQ
jgi:hypothetical protein